MGGSLTPEDLLSETGARPQSQKGGNEIKNVTVQKPTKVTGDPPHFGSFPYQQSNLNLN